MEEEDIRERLKRLAGEVEHLRRDLGIDLEEIRAHIASLSERLEARIRPEEVREIGRLITEIRSFLAGLYGPWEREITKHREQEALWRRRVARGEAELESETIGKYATYQLYHHLPSCERYVRTIYGPYTGERL